MNKRSIWQIETEKERYGDLLEKGDEKAGRKRKINVRRTKRSY